MQLSIREQSALTVLPDDLRKRFGAVEVRLYGSAARGEMDSESDIDLFVVVPNLNWAIEQQVVNRCYDTTLECGRHVSASIIGDRELADTLLRSSPFIASVKREGRPL